MNEQTGFLLRDTNGKTVDEGLNPEPLRAVSQTVEPRDYPIIASHVCLACSVPDNNTMLYTMTDIGQGSQTDAEPESEQEKRVGGGGHKT